MSDDGATADNEFSLARVSVQDCAPGQYAAFRELNLAWIRRHFTIEPSDRVLLDDPERAIVDRGGIILVATYSLAGASPLVVGACALLSDGDRTVFELAKMAVDVPFQGRKVGYLLGKEAVQRARREGASQLRLETNSKLIPALRLYEKLGFTEIPTTKPAYERVDVQMTLQL